MFLAVLFAIGISMPPAILAGSCNIDMQDMSPNTVTEKCCPIGESQSSDCDSEFANHNYPNDSCAWTLSGFCDFDQPETNADAITSITKPAKTFAVSVFRFIDLESTKFHTFFPDLDNNLYAEDTPLFLLNSVFLN